MHKTIQAANEPKEYDEYPIGVGFYAMRITTTKNGKVYSKLIRRDRSGQPNIAQNIAIGKRIPQIGKRMRIKHRARSVK